MKARSLAISSDQQIYELDSRSRSSKPVTAINKNKNIKNIVVKNLTEYGDPISAGMSETNLALSLPKLVQQQLSGSGHFYYAPNSTIGSARRADLAGELYLDGLR